MSDDLGHFDCEVCDEARTKEHHLEIIRAFVERVFEKYDNTKLATELPWAEYLEKVLQDELAAMEKEAE